VTVRRQQVIPLACAASVALHAALLIGLSLAHPAPAARNPPVEVEIREVSRAPEPPRAPVGALRSSARRWVAEPARPAPRLALRAPDRRPPRDAPTPPPSAIAPSAPAKPPPIRIGVSMSSATTAGGGVAVPVGNTLYGEPPRRAADPSSVQQYRTDGYVPATEVTSLPVPVEVDIPRSEYPEEARRLGIEGLVKLRLLVDEGGRVREATLLHDPGHGLGAQAIRNAKRYLRFRPALRDGRPVATEIPFTMAFELD
jgi:protein TonB